MTAKTRNLQRSFSQEFNNQHMNLLVSGCSYTWNNSELHVCSWPYYLRDIAGFNQVIDCSQSGAGSNHIFNSVINEIETGQNITPDNTLVVVMWSGLTRTDVIATQDITGAWHHMSNYHFNKRFSTLSLFNTAPGPGAIPALCRDYKKVVDPDAQIYESMLKILALACYLEHRNFRFVFTSWMNPQSELARVDSALAQKINGLLNTIPYLDEFALQKNQKESDGHPTPDGYLGWTKQCLVPYLQTKNLI